MSWQRGAYTISTDEARLDLEVIRRFLAEQSYWALGRSVETMRRAIEHSLNFGLYRDEALVGFARVVTDRATFAWVADVFVLEAHRGQGLATWLMETIVGHPELYGIRRFVLATRDAHDLYRRAGFTALHQPERWMELSDPASYR